MCFPGNSEEESACNVGALGDADLNPEWGRSPGEGAWQPVAVFLPGEPHGQGSYSPSGCKESDMTEDLACMYAVLVAARGI